MLADVKETLKSRLVSCTPSGMELFSALFISLVLDKKKVENKFKKRKEENFSVIITCREKKNCRCFWSEKQEAVQKL